MMHTFHPSITYSWLLNLKTNTSAQSFSLANVDLFVKNSVSTRSSDLGGLSAIFFKRAREPEVKLRHVVYEV